MALAIGGFGAGIEQQGISGLDLRAEFTPRQQMCLAHWFEALGEADEPGVVDLRIGGLRGRRDGKSDGKCGKQQAGHSITPVDGNNSEDGLLELKPC